MIVVILASFTLAIIYIAMLIFSRLAWTSIPVFTGSDAIPSTFISVIIPARNEEKSLPDLLNALLNQAYPSHLFEVLVIDDFSADGTAEVVRSFSKDNFRIISLAEYAGNNLNSYKKKAIELGIAQSRGQLIITTDADCYMSENWLRTVAQFYESTKPELIVMPVAMDCSNRFLEIFQALDFMSLQGITGAAVYRNSLSMCNGANLAYTKKAFDAVNGFEGIDAIASGDDMLLMNKIRNFFPGKISYLKSPEVIVHTQPMYTWNEFLNQRIRWASKADKYDDKKMFPVLLVVYLFNLFFLIIPIISIFDHRYYEVAGVTLSLFHYWLILLALKIIAELYFLLPVAGFFRKASLLWLFPLAQPFHILYIIVAGWLGKFSTYQWKGRQVK